jgi:DNA polymerase-3 subunit delta'
MQPLSTFEATQASTVEHLRQSLKAKRLHHAFLLVGSAATPLVGIGLAFGQSLMCQTPHDGDACLTCAACRKVAHTNHPDFFHIMPNDRGVLAVGVIRRMAQRLSLRAAEAPRKVVVIEQACSMLPAAQNALLKTLEEPPDATLFILLAQRTGGLLATVRSRCTALHLQAPAHSAAVAHLAQNGTAKPLGELLAPLVGADSDAAQLRIDQGALEIISVLEQTLMPGVAPADIFRAAADLGQSPERTELTLSLLEVMIRDALAHAHDVADAQLYHPTTRRLPEARLAASVDELRRLRRLGALHINRAMALEGLFFTLTDTQHAHLGADA